MNNSLDKRKKLVEEIINNIKNRDFYNIYISISLFEKDVLLKFFEEEDIDKILKLKNFTVENINKWKNLKDNFVLFFDLFYNPMKEKELNSFIKDISFNLILKKIEKNISWYNIKLFNKKDFLNFKNNIQKIDFLISDDFLDFTFLYYENNLKSFLEDIFKLNVKDILLNKIWVLNIEEINKEELINEFVLLENNIQNYVDSEEFKDEIRKIIYEKIWLNVENIKKEYKRVFKSEK